MTAYIENDRLVVHVADDGPGVPPASRTRIFEKFGQTIGSERRGAGLGLTFYKMVVETHGGTIGVDDNPGGGALFTVTLPLDAATGDPLADS